MATSDIINSIKTNLTNAYTKLNDKGATIPTNKNIENLASTIETVTGGGSATLQTKSITITENGTQSVTPDEGYDGLEQVDITTNVPSSGDTPTTGFLPTKWTTKGYYNEGVFYGMEVPDKCFYGDSYNYLTKLDFNETEMKSFGEYSMANIGGNVVLPKLQQVASTSSKYGNYLFNGNTNVLSVTFQSEGYFERMYNSDGQIWIRTFTGCRNLKTITFAKYTGTNILSLDIIGNAMFQNCNALTNVNLWEGITRIYNDAFYNCYLLELSSLPNSITQIDVSAFQNCYALALSSLPENLQTLGASAFYNCRVMPLTSLPNNLLTIGSNAFFNCYELAVETMPDTVTSIGQTAFSGCSKLPLTHLSTALTTLGQSSFYNCPLLKISTIPEGVTVINYSTFFKCTSLVKVSIAGAKNIYGGGTTNGAFGNCTGLKQVWISSNITSAGFQRYVFYGCTALEKIYIDLPRATVEAFSNYKYAFMNDTTKTGIIVCNDDEGFITKEEFDALEVE